MPEVKTNKAFMQTQNFSNKAYNKVIPLKQRVQPMSQTKFVFNLKTVQQQATSQTPISSNCHSPKQKTHSNISPILVPNYSHLPNSEISSLPNIVGHRTVHKSSSIDLNQQLGNASMEPSMQMAKKSESNLHSPSNLTPLHNYQEKAALQKYTHQELVSLRKR